MDILEALLQLAVKYGPGLVITLLVILLVFLIVRVAVNTWSKVSQLRAQGQNQIDNSVAKALEQLAKSNDSLTVILSANAVQLNAIMKSSQDERHQQERVLDKTLDRMEGMLSVMDRSEKAQRNMAVTLNEVSDRITPMQTDLHEMSARTAGIPSSIMTAFDERVAPMIAMLIGVNTQVNGLTTSALTSGQNVESIVLAAAQINQSLSKLLEELKLFKDLFFDRDDHLGKQLEYLTKTLVISTPKETQPS